MFAILIDGEYVRMRAKVLGVKINFQVFVEKLIEQLGLNKSEFFRAYYYTAPPFTATEKEVYSSWIRFIDWLRYHGFQVRLGRVKKFVDEQGQEKVIQKMTDILLTIDSIHLSLNPKIDAIVLVSGDDDYVPVVQKVKDNGVKLILACSKESVGSMLIKEADRRIEIDEILKESQTA